MRAFRQFSQNIWICASKHTIRIYVTWRLLSLCSICVINVSNIHRHTSKLIEQCVANGTVIQLPLPFTLTLTRTIVICNYRTRYAVKLRQRSTKLLTHGIFLHSQSLALSISDYFSEKKKHIALVPLQMDNQIKFRYMLWYKCCFSIFEWVPLFFFFLFT